MNELDTAERMQGNPVDLQQRIAELEQRVRDLQANLDLTWQTINLQSQIIKTIKDDGSDDLTFLVDEKLPSERRQQSV